MSEMFLINSTRTILFDRWNWSTLLLRPKPDINIITSVLFQTSLECITGKDNTEFPIIYAHGVISLPGSRFSNTINYLLFYSRFVNGDNHANIFIS